MKKNLEFLTIKFTKPMAQYTIERLWLDKFILQPLLYPSQKGKEVDMVDYQIENKLTGKSEASHTDCFSSFLKLPEASRSII